MTRRMYHLLYKGWPLTRTERCTASPCRACRTAGRVTIGQRRLWHLGRRWYWLAHLLSIVVTLLLFGLGAVLATAAGLRVDLAAVAIVGVWVACAVVSLVWGEIRARRRPVRPARPAGPVLLDPDTPIDDLPDDYGQGHGPVPDCCVDCQTELLLDAEAAEAVRS